MMDKSKLTLFTSICLFITVVILLPAHALGQTAEAVQNINVQNVRELVDAIGSNRTITLKTGDYFLHTLPKRDSTHIFWSDEHDGPQLNIRGIRNLVIRGDSVGPVRILTKYRYPHVLSFHNVVNVSLEHLILGHIPEAYCSGAVLAFTKSSSINIQHCDLFGSGTYGLVLEEVKKLSVSHSTIRDCTYGIAQINRSERISFQHTRFSRNREFHLVEINRSPNVTFKHCAFTNNHISSSDNAFFQIDKKSSVILEHCTFNNNRTARFTNAPQRMTIRGNNQKQIMQQLKRVDPRYNQIYALTRYRQWMVVGTQAGIALWNTDTGQIEHHKSAFIANSLLVHRDHLWVGTYRQILRFDGSNWKSYQPMLATTRPSQAKIKMNNPKVLAGPNNSLLIQIERRLWRYEPESDTILPYHIPHALSFSPYHILFRSQNEIWAIDFLNHILRIQGDTLTRFPRGSATYPGTDPRRLYLAPNGDIWVIDFQHGFFRFDDQTSNFVRQPTVADKGSDIAIHPERQHIWLLHYTNGLYLVTPEKRTQFFDLKQLQYMRAVWLDADGSIWIGGWNQLLQLYPIGDQWQKRSFVAGNEPNQKDKR